MRIDNGKLEERGRPAQTVERLFYFFVAVSYDSENGKITLMIIPGAVGGDTVNLGY